MEEKGQLFVIVKFQLESIREIEKKSPQGKHQVIIPASKDPQRLLRLVGKKRDAKRDI